MRASQISIGKVGSHRYASKSYETLSHPRLKSGWNVNPKNTVLHQEIGLPIELLWPPLRRLKRNAALRTQFSILQDIASGELRIMKDTEKES